MTPVERGAEARLGPRSPRRPGRPPDAGARSDRVLRRHLLAPGDAPPVRGRATGAAVLALALEEMDEVGGVTREPRRWGRGSPVVSDSRHVGIAASARLAGLEQLLRQATQVLDERHFNMLGQATARVVSGATVW